MLPERGRFFYARTDRQEGLQPPVISHGYNQPRLGYTRFQDAFDWQGTDDPTAWLCIGETIRFLTGLLPGGIERRCAAIAIWRLRRVASSAEGCPLFRFAPSRCSARWPRSCCPIMLRVCCRSPHYRRHHLGSVGCCWNSLGSRSQFTTGRNNHTRYCGFRHTPTIVRTNTCDWPRPWKCFGEEIRSPQGSPSKRAYKPVAHDCCWTARRECQIICRSIRTGGFVTFCAGPAASLRRWG